MSATKRSRKSGRGGFSREALYEIVAEGCRLAAALDGVQRIDVSTRRFRHVTTQPEFEKTWGSVPGPAEICRQLCNGDGGSEAWIEVKRRSFLPPDQLLAVERAALRQTPERVTKQRARYSIRAITKKFGAPRADRDYTASLTKLIRQAQRRSKSEAAAIRRTFATESQILAIYENWNAALRDARVKAAKASPAHAQLRRGMSWPQAAALYELVTGERPTLDASSASRERLASRSQDGTTEWPMCALQPRF